MRHDSTKMLRGMSIATARTLAVAIATAMCAAAPSLRAQQPAPARPDGSQPAPAAAPDATAPAETPAPPPEPPKPGAVVLVADADGLVAEIAGAVHGLKLGDNRIEVAAGDWTVAVRDKDGKALGSWSVHVDPGAESRLAIVTTGEIAVPVRDGRSVEVDGKAVEAKDGVATVRVGPGAHAVVVKEPGKSGLKGSVEVVAGKRATIDPALEAFDPGSTTLPWIGVVGGGALVLAAVLMESLVDPNKAGGDATRWALAGVGTAGFVLGTIGIKGIYEREANPPVRDGKFDVRLAATRDGGMASLALRF